MRSQRIHVSGVVQGVGFRPFIYNLALRHRLHGEVRNTSAGVDIAVEGDADSVQAFTQSLRAEAPPLARIEALEIREAAPNGFTRFEICDSVAQPGAFQPVSPDVALCADCERELFDPTDRRYLYPFINCTHCGPRFTIIRDLPYDRPATTMASFPLCADCEREYHDPADRRFHAQPVACPACGPQVRLVSAPRPFQNPLAPADQSAPTQGEADLRRLKSQSAKADLALCCCDFQSPTDSLTAILTARRLLRAGAIVAVKGLGGFHLACDAANAAAVAELRRRKGRVGKPFAVMLANLATVEQVCQVNEAERALLTGREKPVVLLRPATERSVEGLARRAESFIAAEVAPHVTTLGVMLPYTPLHHLLLNQTDPVLAAEPAPRALVMTSGNYSEEPIATDNAEALARLASLADAFLLHDRDIYLRCDDSVVRMIEGDVENPASTAPPAALFLRRARGYAPYPIHLPFDAPPVLAVGGELKNTFCLTRDRYAFLSQHVGDMENAETLAAFEQSVAHLARLFRIEPEIIAHDLHPDYLSTCWAIRNATADQRRIAIQHHHAHIAAVLADNGIDGSTPVIGLAFDGAGYGPDGAIWGGEFLIADYTGYRRAAQLEYLPLAGGDAATRKPWRIALGYTAALGLNVSDLPFLQAIDPHAVEVVQAQVARRLNAPLTSSLGRLFDAVAALANVRGEVSYEAQAAIELEAAAQLNNVGRAFQPAAFRGSSLRSNSPRYCYLNEDRAYPYRLEEVNDVIVIRLAELLETVSGDVRRNVSPRLIGARFHRAVAAFTFEVCQRLRAQTGLACVALSGGVWQNLTLFNLVSSKLRANGFTVYTHRHTPPNDGGLALGQAAIAAHQ